MHINAQIYKIKSLVFTFSKKILMGSNLELCAWCVARNQSNKQKSMSCCDRVATLDFIYCSLSWVASSQPSQAPSINTTKTTIHKTISCWLFMSVSNWLYIMFKVTSLCSWKLGGHFICLFHFIFLHKQNQNPVPAKQPLEIIFI